MKFWIRTTPLIHLGAERSAESVLTAGVVDDASPRNMLIKHLSLYSEPTDPESIEPFSSTSINKTTSKPHAQKGDATGR